MANDNLPGRPKGVPNKMTSQLKGAVLQSFLDLGGVDYLVKLGKEYPKVYATLLAKLIPNTVNTTDSNGDETGLKIEVVYKKPE